MSVSNRSDWSRSASRGRARTPARSCAARRSTSATWSWRGCCTARSCAAPTPTPDPRHRCLGRARDAGRRRDPDRRRPRRHRALLRPRDQGPADHRARPRALRRRAGGRRRRGDRGRGRGRGAGDRGRLRGAAGARHDRAGARADAAPLHQRRPKIGLFHGLGDLGEQDGNVCYRYQLEAGEIAPAPDGEIVVEGDYTFPAVYQYAMETHATIAHHHGDGVTLWANCQHPFLVQAEIADLFGLEIGSVRIIVAYLGGGFGSKSYTKLEPLTVALARKAGRPVRIVNRVEESMVTSRRHGMRCRMRTTAAPDGTLRSREVRFWMDTGAYADNGPRVTATAGDAAPGPYRWEAVRVEANCVYCNTPPSGSYRAFGATHLQWIGESQIDEVARRAGVDPLELRRRSLVLPGEPVRPDGHRQAARRRPRRRRRARRRGGRLGRAAAALGRPRRQRRAARGGRPPGLARVGARVLGRLGRRLRRHDRDGPGAAHRDGADRGRGARPGERARAGARRRHALHAL